jgi:hypothetical protein
MEGGRPPEGGGAGCLRATDAARPHCLWRATQRMQHNNRPATPTKQKTGDAAQVPHGPLTRPFRHSATRRLPQIVTRKYFSSSPPHCVQGATAAPQHADQPATPGQQQTDDAADLPHRPAGAPHSMPHCHHRANARLEPCAFFATRKYFSSSPPFALILPHS